MMKLSGLGVQVELPGGWEGEIFTREGQANLGRGNSLDAGDSEVARNVMHLANFALPAERGDFGSGAVELMNSGAVLIVLFEHGPESVGTPLFAQKGIPTLRPQHFDPQQMQRTLSGQSGRQVFFQEAGRAFCLYVVLGAHKQRNALVRVANDVLQNLVIEPI